MHANTEEIIQNTEGIDEHAYLPGVLHPLFLKEWLQFGGGLNINNKHDSSYLQDDGRR